MTHRYGGFVDHHAHLLGMSAGRGSSFSPMPVRELHEHCARLGTTPMDFLVGDVVTEGLGDRIYRGLELARSVGLVKVTETGIFSWEIYDALLKLVERGPLPVHVELYAASGLVEQGMRARSGERSLELAGVKFYADGWLGPRTCALTHPFLDEPSSSGILFATAQQMAARMAPLAEDGWRIATHAIGDRAIDAVLDAYELVFGSDCAAAAPRIEHAQVLRRDQIERMSELGVVICVQPGFAYDDAEAVRRGLGTRWPDAYHWNALVEKNVRVITGSDYPVDSLAPLSGLWKMLQNPFDDLDAATAIELMTDEELGSIELSHDLTTATLDELLRTSVESVSVNS